MSRAVFGLSEGEDMTSRNLNGAGAKWTTSMEFGSPVEALADTHTVGLSPSAL